MGTPAVTTRGFGKEEMRAIGRMIATAVKDFDANADAMRAQVEEMCKKFPLYE